MNCRQYVLGVWLSAVLAVTGLAAPVIDPIADVTIPAGKSLILPITATSSSGRPLTYTITSSTNAFAVVMHTNNPFWQLTVAQAAATNAPGAYPTPFRGGLASVTNVGTMTFMLFPEYAPHTVNIFQGLTDSGFYNSNTIFHRVISNFMIQGGDPETNGLGGLVFQYDDEFNPQAIFSGNGQLALANSGIDTDGSQFFVTIAPYRAGDFMYTIFGQMVRGFPVLTNLNSSAVDTNSRPLADEIIRLAGYVTNTTDTVLTLVATNVSRVKGTITVIANDGGGGITTNTFTATTVTDTNSNNQPLFYPNTATELVGPTNVTLTNFIYSLELDGATNTWRPEFGNQVSGEAAPNSRLNVSNSIYQALTYNVTNVDGTMELLIQPVPQYVGPVTIYALVSSSPEATSYWEYGETPPDYYYQIYTYVFGDTPIYGQSNTVTALASVPFTNLVLATFTNGVPFSPATNFTAYVNWGDDTTNAVSVTVNATGANAVLGSHLYNYPGNYPVYVQVQSGIGASATILSQVNVTNPPAPVTNLLTVQITGQGTVAPDYVSAPLAVGDSYSISASPTGAWLFESWTDGNGFVLGTGTNLTFTMYPGMSLAANFTPAMQLAYVQVNGQGTVSPDYNDTSLAVGESYAMTANPDYGWEFVNWTDVHGFVVSTSTNLNFTMAPGLSFTASFVLDVPSLSLVTPANSGVVTNLYSSPVIYTGTVADNATVTSVWFQVNSNGWQEASGTTNWTASFIPAYGITNLFQVYAVNNFGNISTTNTLSVEYMPVGILTLATNGLGSITPNLNNALLPFGTNYTLTAAPASGFTFVNWTGTFSTNNKVLRFTMTNSPSLTANFANETAPTIAITNLASGQQITTNVFSVQGTAHDTWQVGSVLYSLNGAAWANAATTNSWTNWAAPVILLPGTNSIAAYAVDPNGKPSLTNALSFQYLVTNQLTIRAIGLGTISPNYSNSWLEVGRNYTMTATPAAGFAFTNWTIATNWLGGVVTNNATVQFMMASNLTLQVKFAEPTKPTLTITSPTAAQHLTNALPTMVGTATDKWGVSGVWYQLNSGAWREATTTNAWTNWNTMVEVPAGNSTLSAYAQNLGGNYSATSSVTFLSSNSFLLQLNFLAARPLATNGLNFGLLVSTGLTGHIQFSTNLINWSTLTNFIGTSSPLHLLDPAATNSSGRYYRAVIP